jgi:hypothetical protein
VWLHDSRCTLDLFDRGLTLMAGADGGSWLPADPPDWLQTLRIGEGPLRDARADLHTAYGIGPGGAVLVRPHGHVGWRRGVLAADPAAELQAAVARLGLRGWR